MLLDIFCCLFLSRSANLTNHHNGVRIGIIFKQRKRVDKKTKKGQTKALRGKVQV